MNSDHLYLASPVSRRAALGALCALAFGVYEFTEPRSAGAARSDLSRRAPTTRFSPRGGSMAPRWIAYTDRMTTS